MYCAAEPSGNAPVNSCTVNVLYCTVLHCTVLYYITLYHRLTKIRQGLPGAEPPSDADGEGGGGLQVQGQDEAEGAHVQPRVHQRQLNLRTLLQSTVAQRKA